MITKNRRREAPTFANINLLGRCNARCFFCLGEDIHALLSQHDQTRTPFERWQNFPEFLAQCKSAGIRKLYITGQNTDALLYRHLDELIDFLHDRDFTVGLRTNGYLADRMLPTINKCTNSVGYSVHTLDSRTNALIMCRQDMPHWEKIIPATKNPRVAIVVNRHNWREFFDILMFLSRFKNIRYVQARRISTDTRLSEFRQDIVLYERLFQEVQKTQANAYVGKFYGAEQYRIFDLEVNFWRTVETSIGSFNYFTDGTISREYFVIEGYLKNAEGAKCD